MDNYSEDYLLDKRVRIFQPLNGYRASTDAVLLSSLISRVKKNDHILDVGSGTGAISLCLAHRFSEAGINITGLEIQKELAELSNKSAAANHFEHFLHYICCDIKNKPSDLPNCSFSHVITNPPYAEKDMPSPNPSKAQAHNLHDFSLSRWLDFCIKMMRPQGRLYIINRAEALDEILHSLHGRTGNIRIIPLYSKTGQNAKRVIVCAQKDNRSATIITPGMVIHDENGEYTTEARDILRLGKIFPGEN